MSAASKDGFLVPELDDSSGQPTEAPPAYGDERNQMHFSQPGFEAGAAVTDAGRVSININTRNRRLADLLAPAIENQVSIGAPTTLPPAYIPPSLGGQPGQKPPPKLNVVIQIVGSRGDVQPFVALGKVLKETYGHRVRIATHPTFQSFVEQNSLEFFSIGGDPAELMAFMVKHPGLMPGFDAIKSGEVTKRRKGISEMLVGCWRSCIEGGDGLGPAPPPTNESLDLSAGIPHDDGRDAFVADAIIANPPSFAHIHVAEKLGIPLHMMFTMPWTPTRAFPHPLADIQASNADDVLTRLKVPYTYCWSPALISKPNDWGNHVDISGFFFLDLATFYNPDPDLQAFLDAGPPPVYIGFGSIVVDDPDAMTTMIFDAVKASGVRALVSKGWGGLGADDLGIPDGVFMLGNVPHDWLFQKVSAVVHHGGAGTTAAGIKAGKPTLVVPFFGDQPFWGAMIARANAGPDPIPYKQLTAEKLAEAIQFCLKAETVQQAETYGEKIREEKGTDVGGQSFHSHLDVDDMRCSIAPSRTAVWRVRRSKVRLSALAAAALFQEGLIKYEDLKLYQPKDYNTEAQPPDPISAAASSLVMDATGIGMAIADMPREMLKSKPRSSPKKSEETTGPQTPQSEAGTRPQTNEADDTPFTADSRSELGLIDSDKTMQSSTAGPSSSVGDAASTHTASSDTTATSAAHPPTTSRASGAQLNQALNARRPSSPVGEFSLNAAVGAGKSVGKIVGTGVKSPMNFCLGLAKGFRNVPTLYNDETVRPVEKVTDISSGLKVAGKEFGYGLFDGISGLVTQPLKGAEKEGMGGFVKGFGKGIGGIMTKPAAGVWGIPAYTMKGVHAQITKLFTRSNHDHILISRVLQGQRDLRSASAEERQDVVSRWKSGSFEKDLKRFERLQKRAKASPDAGDAADGNPESSSRASWINSRRSTFDERLRSEKQRLFSRASSGKGPSSDAAATLESSGASRMAPIPEDAEFERAIQASVQETSRGNAEEDAAIEAAIRESVLAVRQQGALPDPVPRKSEKLEKDPSIFQDEAFQITDEEYQDLIEQTIRDSMASHAYPGYAPPDMGAAELDSTPVMHPDNGQQSGVMCDQDEELKRAIAASRNTPASDFSPDDAELQQALEASKADAEKQQSQRTEEDIVLEYIKKQSLAEEEYRKQQQAKGKGRAEDDVDDEDLRRAMEESLKMSGQDTSGPSGA
ncbi:Sterol 3-beta-glucosyltransferase UGT80B1-like protein [Emericellopsis cladophorae]|uniref:Sterol 3-beta-glucosyltransferase UGT80B1-like protein n=1 Tax=Emericellopsis cladophorae TaxID=2686198 RepID=A0A9P9Y4B2_9HYPO|nr:Sterol 3-beta-glucosyltransferase UGT80B1-like protein [Emericellopsis cladophorae]KAI6783136.1 Sterol 3-beta-glucosyltransferase UGT80B1-like protein [Emericellopsis cladophorae]